MSTPISRATFLKTLAALGLSAAAAKFLASYKLGSDFLQTLTPESVFLAEGSEIRVLEGKAIR